MGRMVSRKVKLRPRRQIISKKKTNRLGRKMKAKKRLSKLLKKKSKLTNRKTLKKDKKSRQIKKRVVKSGKAKVVVNRSVKPVQKGPPMEDGEPTWELGQNKKVKIRQLQGETFVDIRQFLVYKNGEPKPGNQGIKLKLPQFQQLLSIIKDVNSALP